MTNYTYKINMYGYGGEVVLGHIKQEVYDYFEKNNIDLDEYVGSESYRRKIPEKFKPFEHDYWHDCDNIMHTSGIELSNGSFIEVTDTNGEMIWESCHGSAYRP